MLFRSLPVTFSVDSYPGRTFLGRINQVRLSPKTNQNVVTYTVVARVNNPDQALFPGMTATATVVLTGRENALRIPSTALRFTPAGVKVGPLAPAVGGGRAARVFIEGTDGKPQVANAVTLEVTPDQAERLDLARSVGSLSLVLRNQVEARPVDTAGATKRSLLNEPVVQAAAPTPIARVIQIAQRIVERKPVNTNCVGVISGMHQDKECF